MKRAKSKIRIVLTALVLTAASSCSHDYVPKPAGFVRIDLPEKKYKQYTGDLPYSFEYPEYCRIEADEENNAEPFWINIVFPSLKGKIHISYKKINGNLFTLTEDCRTLAYKHTIKAEAIDDHTIQMKDKKVYGMLYDIHGNVASSVQFFLTDSTRNFLRGSLYFNTQPNKDSLAPVIDFCREDILHFIETFIWK